jgi:biopolymer transport protein ExbD
MAVLQNKKSKVSDEVPTSSMADIAFLLLIFFMVSTVFRADKDRPIEFAGAEATEKMDEKQKDILNVWMESNGAVFINDLVRTMDEVSDAVYPQIVGNPNLVISIRSDRNVPYNYVDQLQKELVSAGALKVVFATELEKSMTRQRR